MTAPLAAPPRSTTPAPARPRGTAAPRARSAAVQRAYQRRAQRTGVSQTGSQSPAAANRASFVVLVMVLLSAALVATLWLSTAAAADSYRLQHSQDTARDLTEHSEQLGREVASMETAPELARRAVGLGMVPAGDPARLVVGPDGAVAVVGTPKAATEPPPPAQAPAATTQATAAGPASQPPASAQPASAAGPGGA
ncbi:MAG: septum formation initiator [Pseudonocardiaceae bacterium]